MLSIRIIPCLDIRDGRVVKGVKFQGLRDSGDPLERVMAYVEQGADEIVVLDVSATPSGKETARDVVRALRSAIDVPLTVGGGVREVDDARKLLLAGADKVAVNSAAVARPELIRELSETFGRQCIVLSVDAARESAGWTVVTHSGTTRPGLDAIAWMQQGAELGAGEILLTSWDRDGTKSGYDLELLSVPIVASGGASTVEHMTNAVRAGASAVLAATIFHDGETTVRAVKNELLQYDIKVRIC